MVGLDAFRYSAASLVEACWAESLIEVTTHCRAERCHEVSYHGLRARPRAYNRAEQACAGEHTQSGAKAIDRLSRLILGKPELLGGAVRQAGVRLELPGFRVLIISVFDTFTTLESPISLKTHRRNLFSSCALIQSLLTIISVG